jgi:hypothetical protein
MSYSSIFLTAAYLTLYDDSDTDCCGFQLVVQILTMKEFYQNRNVYWLKLMITDFSALSVAG